MASPDSSSNATPVAGVIAVIIGVVEVIARRSPRLRGGAATTGGGARNRGGGGGRIDRHGRAALGDGDATVRREMELLQIVGVHHRRGRGRSAEHVSSADDGDEADQEGNWGSHESAQTDDGKSHPSLVCWQTRGGTMSVAHDQRRPRDAWCVCHRLVIARHSDDISTS